MARGNGIIGGIRRFIEGGGFPAFALSLLICWEAFLVAMLFVPASDSALGVFAENFRIWCFGYDPATGRSQSMYVVAMLLPQVLMGVFIVLFWWEPLLVVLRDRRRIAAHLAAAVPLVIAASVGFALANEPPVRGELPFPAEALRTDYAPPEIVLTNQRGETIDLAALRGHVVLLTAVYASCPHTCPVIISQAKSVVAELSDEERADLRLVAVTMDPENDSPDRLAELADMHALDAPLYNLVTGEPSRVEEILDRMQIARQRDPETGVISHANLFLLIDREGRLAYRLGLGERQQQWLASALRVLLKEKSRKLAAVR